MNFRFTSWDHVSNLKIMPAEFPLTPLSLLSQLSHGKDHSWEVSWKIFLELYHEPLRATAWNQYRYHTGGADPSNEFVEDAVANVVMDFCIKSIHRYDSNRGKFRTFLRYITNARVVDLLRKERPLDKRNGEDIPEPPLPPSTEAEDLAYHRAVLATLIEDLRGQIPMRQFQIFEMVKLLERSPDDVAAELGVKRGVVDNTVYRVMTVLREMARRPEYQKEYYK